MVPDAAERFLENAIQRRANSDQRRHSKRQNNTAEAPVDRIPVSERLGVIEDTAELHIRHPNLFGFVPNRERFDANGIAIPAVLTRDLVKAALQSRPTGSLSERFEVERRSTSWMN
jgi:hypothetical protein